jgi:hypothetical protein
MALHKHYDATSRSCGRITSIIIIVIVIVAHAKEADDIRLLPDNDDDSLGGGFQKTLFFKVPDSILHFPHQPTFAAP